LKKTDFNKFGKLLFTLEKCCAGSKIVDKDLIVVYFAALEDVPFDTIRKNGFTHFKTKRFFPQPIDLRNTVDVKQQGIEAFELIRKLFEDNYEPDFCLRVKKVKKKLSEIKRDDLIPMVSDWGFEIANADKISVIRAQFKDAYGLKHQQKAVEKTQKLIGTTKLKLASTKQIGQK